MFCFENYDISLKNYSKREKGREDSWSVETHLNGTQRTSQTNIFLIARHSLVGFEGTEDKFFV